MEPAYIYVLFDPRERSPRYVGRTKTPEPRLRAHVVSATNSNCNGNLQLQAWILALLDQEISPAIFVVETTTQSRASLQEERWFKYFFRAGFDLLNSSKTSQYRKWRST